MSCLKSTRSKNFQVQPLHTHLMRNWTSAERVSISLLFASSPIVTFTPSFTKSLSCKTQHVNLYSLHFIPWVSGPFSVFPSHSPPCPLLTLSSRIFCAPGPTQHEFILEKGIFFCDSPSGDRWRHSSWRTCSSRHCPRSVCTCQGIGAAGSCHLSPQCTGDTKVNFAGQFNWYRQVGGMVNSID